MNSALVLHSFWWPIYPFYQRAPSVYQNVLWCTLVALPFLLFLLIKHSTWVVFRGSSSTVIFLRTFYNSNYGFYPRGYKMFLFPWRKPNDYYPYLIARWDDIHREYWNGLKQGLQRLATPYGERYQTWPQFYHFSDYWRKGLIPRGLRIMKFPANGAQGKTEFRDKWEAIRNKCYFDLMQLLIEEAKKERQ